MAYAVVTFPKSSDQKNNEYCTSEIPMSWLCEGETKCWWPAHSKNVTSLIARRVSPDKDKWNLEDIKVEMLHVSLEKARKVAEDFDYVSTDDGDRGRGKRKIQPLKLTSDEESEPHISSKSWRQITNIALPPKMPSVATYSCLPQSPLVESALNIGDVRTIPVIFSDHQENLLLELEEGNISNANMEDVNCETIDIDVQSSEPDLGSDRNANVIQHIPSNEFMEGYVTTIMASVTSVIQEHLQKISRMYIAINMELKNINQRLQHLEIGTQNPDNNGISEGLEIIKQYFPLSTTIDITTFDNLIESNQEIATHFKKYINGIGGNSAKDYLYRILKKIFTNACAMECSWLGRKNNFGIHRLHFIMLIKDSICSTFPSMKENDFERACGEWFRFAKQRHHREK